MNQALSFGLLFVGGIALTKAVTGSSFADIVKGNPGTVSTTGQNLLSNGVAGAGQSVGAAASSAGSSSGSVPKGTVAGKVTGAELTAIGAAHGWSGQEISDWLNVINVESGGNPNAVNPSSGAAGIAQFINGFSEYTQYGGSASSVTGQLTSMANYIAQRYGTPSAAWAHEQSNHWY